MIHRLIVVVFLFMVLAVWWYGLYPVATVNFNPVFARDWHARIAEVQASLAEQEEGALADRALIERKVLDAMVKEKIAEELMKEKNILKDIRLSLENKVRDMLNRSENYQEMQKDVDFVMHSDFKNVVDKLVGAGPVVFFSELKQKAALTGEEFQDWVLKQVGVFKIYVFLPQYAWDKEAFEIVNVAERK